MKSDEGWQMEHNGRKLMIVVGNFAAYHNGTVITADSAVRYSERHVECFGKVLINRGSTYIYGDRAEYNGNTNIAKVYSKIVKVVNGKATLYTYNFTFNTKRSVGHYTGGGVMVSGGNMIESDRGYVYTEKNEIVGVDRVQMRNEEYEMMGDSVVYNTETDFAQFFSHTHLWNKDKNGKEDDYLYADKGSFDKKLQLYKLTKNGYILTADQEMLCDSLDYYREKEYVKLRRNIQIDDSSHKMLLFGDWGEYWKEPGNVFVTKNPLLISYDTTQSDSVFVRSDSIYLYTRYPIREQMKKSKDSLAKVAKAAEAKVAKNEDDKAAKGAKTAKAEKAAKPEKNAKSDKAIKPDNKNNRQEELKRRQEQANAQKAEKGAQSASQPEAKQEGTTANEATANAAAATTGGETKTIAELRRAAIDSLAKDTTEYGKKMRAKLLKDEAAEAKRVAKAAKKEYKRKKAAERRAVLAERIPLFKRLLGEAKVRDAERRRIEKAVEKRIKDSLKRVAKLAPDTTKVESVKQDSVKSEVVKTDTIKSDTLKADSVKVDSTKLDTLAKFDTMTVKQVRAYFKAISDKEKAAEKRIKQDSLDAKLERIGLARQAKRVEQYRKWEIRDSIYMAKAQKREDELLSRRMARLEKRGVYIKLAESAALAKTDSIFMVIYGPLDKKVNKELDSIIAVLYPEEIPLPVEEEKKGPANIDSLYREIRACGRVRFFRSDVQSVCDSLTTTSVDSIINMYKSPVMWSESNQITAEKMHIKTKNRTLVQADFSGKSMMAAEIDTAHYNQVAGNEMVALFRESTIYRNDVTGNVQTIYFMQEDNSPDITLMAYIEAGDMTSYIEDQAVVAITYRGNPTYTFYPMDKIPETQPTKLPNFKWEISRRPTLAQLFNRKIRPSQRSAKRAIRRPSFPINALLEQRKKDYIRRREWRDRNDVLSIETKEWIRSLR